MSTEAGTTFKLKEGCGFYLDVFGPPEPVKFDKLIPIATRVRYTHMAAVARWKSDTKLWRLTEPKLDWYPPIMYGESDLSLDSTLDGWNENRDFWSTPVDKINKNIVVWKDVGVSYVFGFVKRGIGQSTRSSYSPSSYYGEAEFDPGYFDPKAYIPLYALKSHLQGVEYFFAPIHCVEVL